MIRKLIISFLPIAAMAILTSGIMSDNGKAGRTGSPGETNCTNCHNTYTNNSGGGSITIQSPGMTGNAYSPGQVYNMSVTVSKSGVSLFGVGIEALTTANANGGTLAITDAASTGTKNATVSGVSRTNIVHKLNGGIGTGSKVFNFKWTAPAAGTGNITFYFSGIAGNGNGSDNGDYVYTASKVFTESTTSSCTSAPAQPGSIAGNSTTCSGSSVTYSVAQVSDATTYIWTLPSGWTGSSTSNSITTIAGSSSGTISVVAGNGCGNSPATTLPVTITTLSATITANGNTLQSSGGTSYEWYLNGVFITGAVNSSYTPTQSGNYVVVVYNNGCHASSAPYPFTVTTCTSAPTQPGNITGNSTTCVGDSVAYSVTPVSGATSYTWSLPNGWTGTSTTNSINIRAGSSSGSISVVAVNTCGNSPAATLAVTIPTITATITANGNILQSSVGTSYEWYRNGNLISGATSSTYTATQDGSYTVVVYSNGCHATSSPYIYSTTSCTSAPVQPGSITGNSSICSGSSITYSVAAVSGAVAYTWTLPSGWTGTSTSTSITVIVGGASGTVSVVAANGCGNSPASVLPVTISNMTATITASGNILQASAGTSFEWYFNGNLISGANSSTYTATQSGSYTVTVHDNGCQASSAPYIFSTSSCSSVPPQPVSVNGNSNPCSGSTETYSVTPVNGAMSYSWILPLGWTGNSTSENITVTAGTNPGSIYIIAVNACGISPALAYPVSVVHVIAAITYNNHVLSASQGTSYQWYLDGNIIPGATNSSYTPLQVGDYSVEIFDNNCSGISAPYYVGSVGINDLEKRQYQISSFPNPASDKITIDAPEELRNSDLVIYNVSGQIVYQIILQSGKNIIDVSGFSEGIYSAIAIKENYKSVIHILISR
jgi:hypothetical protein